MVFRLNRCKNTTAFLLCPKWSQSSQLVGTPRSSHILGLESHLVEYTMRNAPASYARSKVTSDVCSPCVLLVGGMRGKQSKREVEDDIGSVKQYLSASVFFLVKTKILIWYLNTLSDKGQSYPVCSIDWVCHSIPWNKAFKVSHRSLKE